MELLGELRHEQALTDIKKDEKNGININNPMAFQDFDQGLHYLNRTLEFRDLFSTVEKKDAEELALAMAKSAKQLGAFFMSQRKYSLANKYYTKALNIYLEHFPNSAFGEKFAPKRL